MSREIKFRAWATSNDFPEGKMYYPNDENPPFLLNMMGDLIHAIYMGDRMYKTIFARVGYNWELMQFTGLKDKSGKDIYEGDKTKQFQVGTGVVIFRDGAFGYELDGQFISYAGNTRFEWNNGQSDEIEVVGNIHDDLSHIDHICTGEPPF